MIPPTLPKRVSAKGRFDKGGGLACLPVGRGGGDVTLLFAFILVTVFIVKIMDEFDIRLDSALRLLREADIVTAFTGAGISTESGISDFRSPGGA